MTSEPERVLEFTCNLCETSNRLRLSQIGRENATCSGCASTVRVRGLLRVLSLELFGANLTLPAFPRVKSIRGLGMSDSPAYAAILADKFDYRNTFYDRAPRFDISNPSERDLGLYDFVISSEVFEHVPPPADASFSNALRLLKPNGVLLLTVPYSVMDTGLEHFPDLYEYAIARLGGESVLVNRTRDGQIQIFPNLVFHLGMGATLEMRELNEKELMTMLAGVGFSGIQIYGESYEPFGVLYPENWSLPIAARRGPFALSKDSAREIFQQFAELRAESAELAKLREELDEKSKQPYTRGAQKAWRHLRRATWWSR